MNPDLPQAEPRSSRTTRLVWLLPLLALIIAVGLGVHHFIERPLQVTIRFESGEGIEAGKTRVQFQGIPVGMVSQLRLAQDRLGAVDATVNMQRSVGRWLTDEAAFWLVKPELSFRGVSGLDTLVTGNYIAFRPGLKGERERVYTALLDPVGQALAGRGLSLSLTAPTLGSLQPGSPVLYRQLKVGEVLDYQLQPDGHSVRIGITVLPQYAHLVSRNSRFWNISGVAVKASLAEGFQLDMGSLLSVVQGGLTFDSPTPTDANPLAQTGDQYPLYSNSAAASRQVDVELRFEPPLTFARAGVAIRYQGIDIGKTLGTELVAGEVGEERSGEVLQVQAAIQPEYAHLLRAGSRFWLVSAEVSLAGIRHPETLLSGKYIQLAPGAGEPQRTFDALSEPPALEVPAGALQVRVMAETLPSISEGAPVLFRKIPVGRVARVGLHAEGDGVYADLIIPAEFRHLVTRHSRFWNSSGVKVSGSLNGVDVALDSLSSLVRGGVSFATPPTSTSSRAATLAQGQVFTLYASEAQAQESGIIVRVLMPQSAGLEAGAAVRYQGVEIGEVHRVTLNSDLQGVTAELVLRESAERFARSGAAFWLAQPRVGLAGIEHLDTLIKGPFVEARPGAGSVQHDFDLLLQPPARIDTEGGLAIVLTAPRLNSIKEGVPLQYRGIRVGRVTGYQLAPAANEVWISAMIEPEYRTLVRRGTRFWDASGISVDVGLFSGAKVRAQSLSSLLTGGIAMATPPGGAGLPEAAMGAKYTLYPEADPDWLEWAPVFELEQD